MDATPQVRTDPAPCARLFRWRLGAEGMWLEAHVRRKLSLRRGGAARATDEYIRFQDGTPTATRPASAAARPRRPMRGPTRKASGG